MGNSEAQKRLSKINSDLNRLSLEVDDLQIALHDADAERQKQEAAAQEEAERLRQEQLREGVRAYYNEVRNVDEAMRLLAERFVSAKQALDKAQALMTDGERTPLGQLQSLWGPTLASAHWGLDAHMELGRSAAHKAAHSKPLADFVYSFLDRWLLPLPRRRE
jgi:hypothetical protein